MEPASVNPVRNFILGWERNNKRLSINNCGASALTDFFEVGQRTFPVCEVFVCEQESSSSDADLVAVGQSGLVVYSLTVDENAVFAFHIERAISVSVFVEMDLHVLTGNVLIKDLDWKGLIPADDICATTEWVIVAFVGS